MNHSVNHTLNVNHTPQTPPTGTGPTKDWESLRSPTLKYGSYRSRDFCSRPAIPWALRYHTLVWNNKRLNQVTDNIDDIYAWQGWISENLGHQQDILQIRHKLGRSRTVLKTVSASSLSPYWVQSIVHSSPESRSCSCPKKQAYEKARNENEKLKL